ncbi:unnamed protein product [Urochloa decumbens]|uniref:Non-specific lipid-transfer protein n=1 Tax=Urochloa decumbens TaxID=240449 RepID=A0ABC9BH13_9POAL
MARARLVAMALVAAALFAAAAATGSEAAATTTTTTTTCAEVSSAMSPCFAYARGAVTIGPCCAAVRDLAAAATTTAERRFACSCLKAAAARVAGLDAATAAKIPARCAVKIPYTISPTFDCSRVS